MSDYDLQNSSDTRRRAMDYSGERSGNTAWVVIGLVAVVVLFAVLVFGGGSSGDGTSPSGADGTAAPAADPAPAATGTDAN